MAQFGIGPDVWVEVVAAGGAVGKQIAVIQGEALLFVGAVDTIRKPIRLGSGGQRTAVIPGGKAASVRAIGTKAIIATGDFAIGNAAPQTIRRAAGYGYDGGNRTRASNGTNNSFNTWRRFYTPVPIPNPSVVFPGFHWSASAEFDNPQTVTYECALRVGSTVVGRFTSGGAQSIVVPGGTIAVETDQMTGYTIPAGYFDLIYYGSVPSGAYYYTDFFRGTTIGLVEEGVGLASKVMTPGSIGNAAQYLPAGPVGVKGDMPINHRMFMLPGDSISVGVGGYAGVKYPMVLGILAGLIVQRDTASAGYVHFGRSGAGAVTMQSNLAKRVQLAVNLGVTDSFSNPGVNDFSNVNNGAAAVAGAINQIADVIRASLPQCRLYQATIMPATTVTSSPTSDTNQTTLSAFQDGRRNQFNSMLRAGGYAVSPKLAGVVEFATPAENAINADWWKAGYSTDASTALHPSGTGGAAIVDFANTTNPLGLS